MYLQLALDVAHHSSWRLGATPAGQRAKTERLVRVLATAARAEAPAWSHLASRLNTLSETTLREALTGGGSTAGARRPLLLFSLLQFGEDANSCELYYLKVPCASK